MKIPLERYVYFGIGVAALTIALMSAVQIRAMHSLVVSGNWVDHTNRVVQEITATRGAAKAAESAGRGLALTGDPAFLEALKESVASANQHAREIRSLTADNPRQQRRLDELETLLVRFQLLDQMADKRRLSGADAATQFAETGGGISVAAAIESLCAELQNEEYSLLNVRRAALEGSTTDILIVTGIASVFSLLLLGSASAAICFEMRKRRKLETSLQSEKDLFTTLMNTVPACIYFKDAESRFLRINAAMGRRLGISDVAEAIGKSDADYYAPEYAKNAQADEKSVIQTGRGIIDKEELEVSGGGREMWVVSSKLPVVDPDGSIHGTFGVSGDISARKQAEQALVSANSRLTEWNGQLELRNREILLLGEMGELLQTCASEAEAERILIQFAPDLFPALSGALSMIKASRNAVERTASWGDAAVLAAVFLPEDCWALRRGQPHGSGRSHGRIKCAHIEHSFTGSFVCIPMMAHGETLGVLHLLDGPHLDESELRLAAMVAERMSLAVANLRLREALKGQSIRDPLTGLFNRRYMEESLERELHRADRDKSTIGVIMVDLDHFKEFNDTFGHDGGDAILKEFSELLRTQTRKEDIVCRYGGEEFLIVLPAMSLAAARDWAEGLLGAMRNMAIISRGRELGPICASIGVALYPAHGDTMRALIHSADDALYNAKAHGRDCVVLAATRPIAGSPHLDGRALVQTHANGETVLNSGSLGA